MEPNSTHDKVIRYFQNPDILYSDWYMSYYSSELFPGQPVATIPSIGHMKQSFEHWFNKRKKELYNLICVEWNYPAKRKKYSNKVELSTALAEFLMSSNLEIPAPITVAVLLVRIGLDKFCL